MVDIKRCSNAHSRMKNTSLDSKIWRVFKFLTVWCIYWRGGLVWMEFLWTTCKLINAFTFFPSQHLRNATNQEESIHQTLMRTFRRSLFVILTFMWQFTDIRTKKTSAWKMEDNQINDLPLENSSTQRVPWESCDEEKTFKDINYFTFHEKKYSYLPLFTFFQAKKYEHSKMGTHREYHLLVVSLPLCETPFLLTNKIKKKVNSLCIKNKVSTFHLYQCTKTKIEKRPSRKLRVNRRLSVHPILIRKKMFYRRHYRMYYFFHILSGELSINIKCRNSKIPCKYHNRNAFYAELGGKCEEGAQVSEWKTAQT